MIRIFTRAKELPYIWDNIFENNHYMLKDKLAILEECNECSQRYIIINNRSAFVIYKLKLNMFTFSKFKFNITVNIIGVPCSVSKHGYVLDAKDISDFEYYIRKQKKNCIILNAEKDFSSPLFVKGETLPTCKLNILWNSFDDFKLNLEVIIVID